MKKLLLFLLMIAGAVFNEAQAYDYLELVKTDGSKKSVSTQGLEIDVTPTLFVVTNDLGESVSVDFSTLKSMTFTNSELKDTGDEWNDEEPDNENDENPDLKDDGGDNPDEDDENSDNNGSSSIDRTFTNGTAVEVFSIDGTRIGKYASINEASRSLSSGIYIMRDENNNSIKIRTGK